MSETQSKDGKKSLSPQSSKTNLNNFSVQSNNPLCLKKGADLLKLSYPYKSKQLDDQCIQHIRITYSKTKNNKKQTQKSQTKELQVVCIQHDQFQINKGFQQPQVTNVQLKDGRKSFTIGKLEKETIELNGQLQGIKAEIFFNDVQIPDHVLGLIHLEVNYEFLKKDKTWVEHCQSIESILGKVSIKQTISYKAVEEISYYLYTKKRKPRISDISKKIGNPTLIQINQQCENQVLQDSQIFRVGLNPQLIVKRIFVRLEHFFKKYSREKNQNDMIFFALQSLQSKVQFSGINPTLAELFMHVQSKLLSKDQFLNQISDENLMIYDHLQSCLSKNCILMNVQGDNFEVEHFLLVADTKNVFSFGRNEYSDIQFNQNQVSRFHGQIEFIPEYGQWIIKDGQYDQMNNWKVSSFGLWLEMKAQTFYFLDFEQNIKLGNYVLQMRLLQNELDQVERVDNINYKSQIMQERTKDIDSFVQSLLERQF